MAIQLCLLGGCGLIGAASTGHGTKRPRATAAEATATATRAIDDAAQKTAAEALAKRLKHEKARVDAEKRMKPLDPQEEAAFSLLVRKAAGTAEASAAPSTPRRSGRLAGGGGGGGDDE
jgi:hypothetical protein